MIVLMRHQNTQDSHKHAKTCIYDRAYETPRYRILISTLKYANMIVLMSHQNAQDSHKHAKTSIYERAYETPKYGILINTLKHYAYMIVLMRDQNTGYP
jgi:hypothetical protein